MQSGPVIVSNLLHNMQGAEVNQEVIKTFTQMSYEGCQIIEDSLRGYEC